MNQQKLAKIISYSLDPSLMWPLFVIMILVGTGLTVDQMKQLFVPLFVLELVAPVALLGYFRHIGKVSDWEMTDVKERRAFFVWVVLLHTISLACLYFWGNELAFEIRLSMWILSIIGTAVTFVWKVSIHLAAFAAVVFLLNVLFGWHWWPLFLLMPVLMWARIVRKKHTFMQTLVGSTFTICISALLLWMFNIPLVI